MIVRGHDDETIVSVLTDRDVSFLSESCFTHARTSLRSKAADWLYRCGIAKGRNKIGDTAFDIEEASVPQIDQAKKNRAKGVTTVAESKGLTAVGLSSNPEPWEKELELINVGPLKPPLVKPSYANLRLILANSCDGADFLNLNTFAQSAFYTGDTPWGAAFGQPRSSENEDALIIKSWFHDKYKVETQLSRINEVLDTTALQNSFHPVKDYLQALRWDGVSRIDHALAWYCGADMPEPYLSEVSRKFFIGAVRRIFDPGCQLDSMLVLEGHQGIGKSSFGRILASDAWFIDSLPPFHDKDAALYLIGTWICELAEMAAITRSDNESAKAFISRRTDKIRPPFGRRRMDYPRSNLFIGTTNKRDYLNDPTGNRRYWPVRVSYLNFSELAKDRDQLWAEATLLSRTTRERLYLTGKASEQALQIQESRRIDDESELLVSAYRQWEKEGNQLPKEVTMHYLFTSGPFCDQKANPAMMRHAGNVMRTLGYYKNRTMKHNFWTKE